MKLIVCIDDRMGIAYNHRRISGDREVLSKIKEITEGSLLYVSPASQEMMDEAGIHCTGVPDYLTKCGENDYCFLEFDKFPESIKPKELILFRWNRHYPSDVKFDFDRDKWNLESTIEFPGYSHEKITEEVYTAK